MNLIYRKKKMMKYLSKKLLDFKIYMGYNEINKKENKMNIFKDYVMLKKYPVTERNLNGEIVCFTYNKKTNIINIPHDQIKDVTDISLIKKLVFEKVEFIIDHNFKSFTGKFI